MNARHEGDRYVRQSYCAERHASSKWVQRFQVGLTALFLTSAIYAVDTANRAMKNSQRTQIILESHMTAEAESTRYVRERLDEIRADIREQRTLLNSLLRQRPTGR